MQANIYTKINQMLSWKRVVSFNLMLLVALVIPLSVKLTQENADNRSNAANNVIPSATPIPNYPNQPPVIERVTLFYGKPGDTIVLLGKNFGAFPWDKSHIFIGNREVKKDNIVRWQDKIIEVAIPEGAITGKVWVRINGKSAIWPGTLLIYDPVRSGKIGLEQQGGQAVLWLTDKNHQVKNLDVELSFTGGLITVTPLNGVEIKKQINQIDDFGNKMKLKLELKQPIINPKTPLITLTKSTGRVELLSARPTTIQGRIVSVWSDPLSLKVSF